MHQNQRIDTPPGNHRGSRNRLTKGRWRTQDAGVVMKHGRNRRFLIET